MQWEPCNFQPFNCAFAGREVHDLWRFEASLFVGYHTHAVASAKYYALAIQLEDVATGNGEIAIKDLLTCNNPKSRSSLHPRADQIHVWNGMGWTKYYYHTSNTWCAENTTEETSKTVKSGDTVFFLRSTMGADGDTITLSGGVSLSKGQVVTATSPAKYFFVSYPWPTSFAIADFKNCIANIKGRTSLHPRADQVHRWNGMGWTKFYYHSTYEGFVKDGEDKVTEEVLDPGEGVFFLRSTMGVDGDALTFTKPTGL